MSYQQSSIRIFKLQYLCQYYCNQITQFICRKHNPQSYEGSNRLGRRIMEQIYLEYIKHNATKVRFAKKSTSSSLHFLSNWIVVSDFLNYLIISYKLRDRRLITLRIIGKLINFIPPGIIRKPMIFWWFEEEFTPFKTEAVIIQKPVQWFAPQINGLVSKW